MQVQGFLSTRMLRNNYHVLSPLVTLFSFIKFSHAIETPTDLLSLVPSCARQCVDSFIRINYGFPDNAKPSLEALCTRSGATEYTIGEALMQCLNAELSVKFCDRQDVTGRMVQFTCNNLELTILQIRLYTRHTTSATRYPAQSSRRILSLLLLWRWLLTVVS